MLATAWRDHYDVWTRSMSSFATRYKKDWEDLESLVERGRKSVRRLSPAERQQLDSLYRRTTIHLARVSTRTRNQNLIAHLNGLTAAAHSLIYLPPRKGVFAGTVDFVYQGFARAIARNWRSHGLSALLLVGGALLGYFAAMSDPLLAHALWPTQDVRQPGSTRDQLLAVLRGGREQGSGLKFIFASFLFQHNLKVGLLALATGFLAGVPTIILMLFNGMMLGVFVAIHHQAGIHAEMWAWLLPHGVTELGAIVLCGGVGLMLGAAVIRPGHHSRNRALQLAGRESALICIGVAAMLLAAAIIESFVRQSHWSTETRLVFAAATGVFWAIYITHGALGERRDRNRRSATTGSAAAVQ